MIKIRKHYSKNAKKSILTGLSSHHKVHKSLFYAKLLKTTVKISKMILIYSCGSNDSIKLVIINEILLFLISPSPYVHDLKNPGGLKK